MIYDPLAIIYDRLGKIYDPLAIVYHQYEMDNVQQTVSAIQGLPLFKSIE